MAKKNDLLGDILGELLQQVTGSKETASIGEELLIRFGEACSEISTVEKNPKLDGRNMAMFLSPKNTK